MKTQLLTLAIFSISLSACTESESSTDGDNTADVVATEPAVELVQPQDATLNNSPIIEDIKDITTSTTKAKKEPCFWNDKKFSDGAVVCESRRQYACWDGRWVAGNSCPG